MVRCPRPLLPGGHDDKGRQVSGGTKGLDMLYLYCGRPAGPLMKRGGMLCRMSILRKDNVT